MLKIFFFFENINKENTLFFDNSLFISFFGFDHISAIFIIFTLFIFFCVLFIKHQIFLVFLIFFK